MISISAFLGIYQWCPGVSVLRAHVIFGMPIMTLMFRNAFAGLPIELFKAARVDGAGFVHNYMQIILPMSKPIIVAAFDLAGDLDLERLSPSPRVCRTENLPMTAQLNLLVAAELGAHEYNVDMAATLQTALIPLLIYFLSGKWFVRGIASGAVKG